MHDSARKSAVPLLAHTTQRRNTLRALGVAWATLAGAVGLVGDSVSAKRVKGEKKANKKRKKGSPGPQGPIGSPGPQGTQGPQGLPGEQGLSAAPTNTFSVSATPSQVVPITIGEFSSSQVDCPEGSVVTGGGHFLGDVPSTSPANLGTVSILRSVQNGNGWFVIVMRTATPTSPEDVEFGATATCANTA